MGERSFSSRHNCPCQLVPYELHRAALTRDFRIVLCLYAVKDFKSFRNEVRLWVELCQTKYTVC